MSYQQVSDHRRMVFDAIRNSAYERAIRHHVTKDSIVLDLGAGLGVLGLLAASAGARHVHMVEPAPVAGLTRRIAENNGFADRITVYENRIEDVTLPEPVDIILSVFTGNLLFSEDLLPSLFHARDRWLKPGGKLLPDRAQLFLCPFSSAELHEETLACWSSRFMSLDFSPARIFASNEIQWLSRNQIQGKKLGISALLADLDLMQEQRADCHGQANSRITQAGLCHGLLAWIRLSLGEEWLSTDPDTPEMHWFNPFLPLDPPLLLQANDNCQLSLHRPMEGDWTWSVSTEHGNRRHSTFLARTDNRSLFRKLAPFARPSLDEKGSATALVLSLMDGSRDIAELASRVHASFPGLFDTVERAEIFVQALVRRHGKDPIDDEPTIAFDHTGFKANT